MTFLTRSGEDAYKAQSEPKSVPLVGFARNSCSERKFLRLQGTGCMVLQLLYGLWLGPSNV